MAAKKNAAAQDLRTPKYRPRIVKNLKKAYLRRPKHPASAADAFSGASTLTLIPALTGWPCRARLAGALLGDRDGQSECMVVTKRQQNGQPLFWLHLR